MFKKRGLLKVVITSLILVLVLNTFIGYAATGSGTIKVGSKDFTEQLVLGQLTLQALSGNGYKVEDKGNVTGSEVSRKALLSGDVSMYWEYTGTAWMSFLQHTNVVNLPDKLFNMVKTEDAKNGLVWLPYSAMNDTYCVIIRKADADKNKITTMSQFAKYVNAHPKYKFTADQEYTVRPDGLPGMLKAYGIKLSKSQIKVMIDGVIYKSLKNKQTDGAIGFSTDGRIPGFGFVALKDDKNYFPVYSAAPVIRKDVLDANPGIAKIMLQISSKLDNNTMIKLNAQVDIDGKEPKQVAHDWLVAQKIIKK